MLQPVDIGKRTLQAYRGVAPDDLLDALLQQAQSLHGARILHLNATPYGGGVSELLRSLVPLLVDLGLRVDWRVISGDDQFFQVTKTLHNGLQGAAHDLSDDDRAIYLATVERNAAQFSEDYDVVVVHDPQPAALLPLHGKGAERWIWRSHIDTSTPNASAWEFLRQFLGEYDAAVFTMREFVPPDLPISHVEIIPPAIDPLSPKNLPLPTALARQILDWIGIELDRPLITQVSRFDPWKDPLGVIAAYRLVRQAIPDVQLALVGSMAIDDPESWEVYRRIQAESANDPLIHVFTNLTGVGNIEVNAFQRFSKVIVQKSLREGFGLVVSEALWKGTPVVAGRAGGISLQMADGVGGLLVDNVAECAQAIIKLLQHPQQASALAKQGQTRAQAQFLLPRLLLNEIALLSATLRSGPADSGAPIAPQPFGSSPGSLSSALRRDPVCGMILSETLPPITAQVDNLVYAFCSRDCRNHFLAQPDHGRFRC